MSETNPVLIVGAGPTGMTAAMELARLGVPVRIVDKLATPTTTSRALAVQARTLELFAQRGLTPEMLRLGNRASATTFYRAGKRLGQVKLDEIKSRYNYILMLSQAETERLLREQLARQGVTIERGTELIAFAQLERRPPSQQPGGVKAVLRHAAGHLEELDVAYLVCAEGAHSIVRHTSGLPFEGESLRETYALADLYLDGDLPDDEITLFNAPHGLLAVFPMGNRHFRFIATDPEKHGRDASPPTLAELQTIYDADAHIPARLRDLTWSSRFWINSRMLRTLRSGRIFFGGDSAHVHSPAGGQGMNTGIQDMINLGWKLALVWHGQAVPELLDTYEQDRLPVIRNIVTRTEAATNAMNSTNALVHGVISHVLPLLLDTHFVQETGTGVISEIAANFRASPLSQTRHAVGTLRAGDRVPDPDVRVWNADAPVNASPRETPLYGCLDPSRFTLLVTDGKRPAGQPWEGAEWLRPWQGLLKTYRIAAFADETAAAAAFEHLFGAAGSLLLVRPDAYLGFVGGLPDLPVLVEWMERWLPISADPAQPARR